jgi:hypothetical protein
MYFPEQCSFIHDCPNARVDGPGADLLDSRGPGQNGLVGVRGFTRRVARLLQTGDADRPLPIFGPAPASGQV